MEFLGQFANFGHKIVEFQKSEGNHQNYDNLLPGWLFPNSKSEAACNVFKGSSQDSSFCMVAGIRSVG